MSDISLRLVYSTTYCLHKFLLGEFVFFVLTSLPFFWGGGEHLFSINFFHKALGLNGTFSDL